MPDQELIVGRNPDVGAAPQKFLQQQPVVLAEGDEVLVGYAAGLVLDAFAQAHRDAGFREAHHIVEAAPHVGLDHGSDVLVALVQIYDHVQRDARVGRVLHVHPHESALLTRVRDYLLQVRPAQLLVDREPEARELDRDPRFEVMFVEDVYDLLVLAERPGGVSLALGALAEQVYGSDATRAVQVPDGGHRLLQRVARDVAARDPAYHGPRDSGHGVGYGLVQYPHTQTPTWRSFIASLHRFY